MHCCDKKNEMSLSVYKYEMSESEVSSNPLLAEPRS